MHIADAETETVMNESDAGTALCVTMGPVRGSEPSILMARPLSGGPQG
jgi:hypothetical protein